MKFKLSTLHLLGLALLVTLLSVAGTVAFTNKTVPHKEQHTTQKDFWDSIRMKPVKVISYDGKTIQYQFDDEKSVELGSLETDERTQAPEGIKTGKTYFAIYCEPHKTAYQLLPR